MSWDADREDGPYRLAWSLPGGNGYHELPSGIGIRHVSASLDGQLLAVSAGADTQTEADSETVYVLRTMDGNEVYRRNYAPDRPSFPVFIGRGFFAVTVMEDGKSRVDVLRVPADIR